MKQKQRYWWQQKHWPSEHVVSPRRTPNKRAAPARVLYRWPKQRWQRNNKRCWRLVVPYVVLVVLFVLCSCFISFFVVVSWLRRNIRRVNWVWPKLNLRRKAALIHCLASNKWWVTYMKIFFIFSFSIPFNSFIFLFNWTKSKAMLVTAISPDMCLRLPRGVVALETRK